MPKVHKTRKPKNVRKQFTLSEAARRELDTLRARIAKLSADENISPEALLFGRSILSKDRPTLLIPEVFDLSAISLKRAKEHYEQYGFAVFNVLAGETFREQCLLSHAEQIENYLKKFNMELNKSAKVINAIRRKKEFPSKLNQGLVVGTLFQSTEETNMDEDLQYLDDYLAQSEIAWILRSFCAPFYRAHFAPLFEKSGELLASVEDATCVFTEGSPHQVLQSDDLHFLTGVLKKGTRKDARGFLSINDGDSFATIPGFHLSFGVLRKNMMENRYTEKRTSTRAIPPAEYKLGTDIYVKRILLKAGQYLIYDHRMPVQLKAQTINTQPHMGMNVMFFDPIQRDFTSEDHRKRMEAAMVSHVVNDERVFGHTFFIKRRGLQFLLPGKFRPILNRLICPSFFRDNPHYKPVGSLIYQS